MPDKPEVQCGECQAPMKLLRSKYPGKDGQVRYYYGCSRYPACKGRAGADGWGDVIGVPADRETREARHAAYLAFCAYYSRQGWSKSKAYRWIAQRMKMEKEDFGFARLDKQQSNQLVEIIKRAQERAQAKGAKA